MLPHLASAPNVNHLWAALLVEELVRQGTTFFVVCPGSRSTPLAVAVATNPRAEALVHWDERAAGFVALGWGRATGRPAAVVTTSGTAVANLLPAAVEARQSGVPLLLLTADRPPELRETGANQAIRQLGLFSTVARWEHDLGTPNPDVDPAVVLTTAAEAAARAGDGGPVHLNLPFREPLAAAPDGTDAPALLDGLTAWAARDEPYTRRVVPAAHLEVGDLAHAIHGVGRGVVVLGPLDVGDVETPTAAAEIADRLGWPLLPDLLSGARLGRVPEAATTAYDLALGSAAFRAVPPEAVLQFGGRPTSKRLARWIADARPGLYVHVHARAERIDPDHRVTHRIVAPVGTVARALDDALASRDARRQSPLDDDWRTRWRAASQAAAKTADAVLSQSGLSEPVAARVLVRRLPKGGGLVTAASMPVRDLDVYAEAGGSVVVTANRGASGIDGTVATAAGFARGRGLPTGLLIGDLALLHDQTSLALLREGPPVIVVCVNNDGGGIFHRLPIQSGSGRLADDTFERFFGTPHGLTFREAAAQVGLAYDAPDSVEAFEAAVDRSLTSGESVVVEVRTDRHEQAALRARVEAACAEAVDRVLEEG